MKRKTNDYNAYLWAKSDPFTPLYTHMLCVGICAQEYIFAPSSYSTLRFLQSSFDSDAAEVRSLVGYICSLHDIGKAHPIFQRKSEILYAKWKNNGFGDLFLNEIETEPFRHEYYSGKVLKRIWKTKDFDDDTVAIYSTVIELHHQKHRPRRVKEPKAKEWLNIQSQLEKEMYDVFLWKNHLKHPHNVDAVCILLTSILILVDWITSSSLFGDVKGKTCEELRVHSRYVMRKLGVVSDGFRIKCDSFSDVWPAIIEPRPIQQICEGLDPSALLTIIEAPMGEGKTEASLFHAARTCQYYKKGGLYMALPTQSTSNQMYQRINELLVSHGGQGARLLHGAAKLLEDVRQFHTEDEREAMKWMRPLRLGILAENGVGTVDQVMASVLLSRFSMIRLAGLENKVLIIDEIHAYDMYMSEIIEIMLKWCRALQIPVILLSATLQRSQKKRYLNCFAFESKDISDHYPLLTQVCPNGELVQKKAPATFIKELIFTPIKIGYDPEEIAARALRKVEDGGCIVLIMNTVKHAQEVFLACQKANTESIDLMLFHGRFTVGRRKEIEEMCVSKYGKKRAARPQKGILVATQVVEQSIDLDFDGMISEIAPIDLLLQRAGRVHRHTQSMRPIKMSYPEIEILLPKEIETDEIQKRYGNLGVIYEPFVLSNTEKMLINGMAVKVPDDVRSVIETVYTNVTNDNIQAHFSMIMAQDMQKNKADACIYTEPQENTFFPIERPFPFTYSSTDDGFEETVEVSTRIGSDQIRIAFCSKNQFETIRDGKGSSEIERSIYYNSVSLNIHPRAIVNGQVYRVKKGMLRGIYLLNGEHEAEIGNYKMFNDLELGVSWEVMQ